MKKFIMILNIILVVNLLLITMVNRCIGGGIIVEGSNKWEDMKLEVIGEMYEKAEKEGRSYLTPKEKEILEKELTKIEKQEEREKEKEFQKLEEMMTPQRKETPPIRKIIRTQQPAPMTKYTQKILDIQHKQIKQVRPPDTKTTLQKQEEIKTKKQKSIMPFVLISLMLCAGVGMYLSLKKIK